MNTFKVLDRLSDCVFKTFLEILSWSVRSSRSLTFFFVDENGVASSLFGEVHGVLL